MKYEHGVDDYMYILAGHEEYLYNDDSVIRVDKRKYFIKDLKVLVSDNDKKECVMRLRVDPIDDYEQFTHDKNYLDETFSVIKKKFPGL